MTDSLVSLCLAEVNRQLDDYRVQRVADPARFGSADGRWDGTPDGGPMPLMVFFKRGDEWRWRVLWGIHKYEWPLSFWYCIGTAADSRGERTDPALEFDIRELPKSFIGRFDINRSDDCGRKRHVKIIGRALAADFDLASISPAAKPPVQQTAWTGSAAHDDDIPF